ncbi:MAG: hypothetical protein OEL20_05005 [Sulfuritalea sp.]|nr:hypothetical protein [Sulfuritalea sp.]
MSNDSDSQDPEVIDYSHAFPNAVAAQGKGCNVLILYKLDKPTTVRFDGKPATYELVYRWLSQTCQNDSDQAWACVQGSEVTYWQAKELGAAFIRRLKRETANLFSQFSLIG